MQAEDDTLCRVRFYKNGIQDCSIWSFKELLFCAASVLIFVIDGHFVWLEQNGLLDAIQVDAK
jgi:hypothetical protein